MPYNNTPVAPPDSHTGMVCLPLARTKKIISADDDIAACSNNAAFAITVAAEEFIYHLARMTHNVVKSERRKRGAQVTYNDVANAIARVDSLEFLTDVVPKTMTYSQYRKKTTDNQKSIRPEKSSINGQRTLDGMTRKSQAADSATDVKDGDAVYSDMAQVDDQTNGLDTRLPKGSHKGGSRPQSAEERPDLSRGQGYDAVRNDFISRPDVDVSMDEE
ncbi:MAG: hypothetical protein M1828_000626 [Chrysothrix sp. TS-e1954]|nr:MAG: hypothetical protein M1828_000626 [Chrysothrix sp. TS-e1954]